MRTDERAPVVMRARRANEAGALRRDVLTIISWNIYRNNRPTAIEDSLKRFVAEHDPDVFLIQEAPAYEVEHFADAPVFDGYNKIYEPMHVVHRSRGLPFKSTGQLTLSRHPFSETTTYELPGLPYRARRSDARGESVNRIALYTRLTTRAGRRIGLYNVHLENRTVPTGRLRQVQHLLGIIAERHDDVAVVGGDFNTFLTAAFERCVEPFYEAGFLNLFQDDRLRLIPRLDYFMVRGAGVAERIRLRGRGSDHQPIMARLVLEPGEETGTS